MSPSADSPFADTELKRYYRMRRAAKLGELRGLARRGRRQRALRTRPRGPRIAEPEGPFEMPKWWLYRISEDRAKRALRLKEQGVEGTLPELLAWEWLTSRGIPFEAQVQVGSKRVAGGATVDFVIEGLTPGRMIWRVQGQHWHGSPVSQREDRKQLDMLLATTVLGGRVEMVVDLWENSIYYNSPRVFLQAEGGVEI